jgi:hypothetical protein
MAKKLGQCFCSYAHSGIDKETLDYIINLFRKYCPHVEFLIDKDLKYGHDFGEFMDMLYAVDCAVIFLTPEYKRKVDGRQGGAYQEYTNILDRLNESRKSSQKGTINNALGSRFSLFPILFSGSSGDSVPEHLKLRNYLDLTSLLVARRDGRFKLFSKPHLNQIKFFCQNISASLNAENIDARANYAKYFDRLFIDVKADWKNPRDINEDYANTLFVKTRSYKRISDQHSLIVTGRKGSGKSTVSEMLSINKKAEYLDTVNIQGDYMNMELLYAIFSQQPTRTDSSELLSQLDCFSYAWQAFMYICCMDIFVHSRKRIKSDNINKLGKFLNKIIQKENISETIQLLSLTNRHYVYFTYCFSQTRYFIDKAIALSRSDEKHFYADLKNRLDRQNYIEFVIGSDHLSALSCLFKRTRKKVLITLDGLDTRFDLFRRNAREVNDKEVLLHRSHFESDWLRSLVMLVINMHENRFRDLVSIDESLDFCIAAPEDRFYELMRSELDSSRYSGRYTTLSWTGVELSILLRKRLERLSNSFQTNSALKPRLRLDEILEHSFSYLPRQVSFVFNEKPYEIDLFLYVLRHTFWRPREILLYYADILAMAEPVSRRGDHITSEDIRATIKKHVYQVLRDEFFNEFSSTLFNLEDIVNLFSDANQIISYEDVMQKLSSMPFQFAVERADNMTPFEKFSFLYQIGFIGVKTHVTEQEALNLSDYSFMFNDGMAPLRSSMRAKLPCRDLVIHPSFCEYLQLYTKGQDLVLVFTWDHLEQCDRIYTLGSRRL